MDEGIDAVCGMWVMFGCLFVYITSRLFIDYVVIYLVVVVSSSALFVCTNDVSPYLVVMWYNDCV